ncbi:MAG: PAS domain S-box protein [Candidatus Cloacimonetes bacterium]|nr:PAS domain S-box protein [Candidatus Cloacimonadota bacterium]
MLNKEEEILTENGAISTPAELDAKFVRRREYTRPFWQFFGNLTYILFILFCLYDIFTISYQDKASYLIHYIPGIIFYLYLLINIHFRWKAGLNLLHLAATLFLILPLLHLAITSPEGIAANYFFISIILITLYYIIPGKNISTAILMTVLLSLLLFTTLFISKGPLGSREVLNLLFFILINLAGLMITYMTQSLLHRITDMSERLRSESTRLAKMREEFINTLGGLSVGILLLEKQGKVIINNDSFRKLSGTIELEEGRNLYEILEKSPGFINRYFWQKVKNNEELGEEINGEIEGVEFWYYLKGIRLTGELLQNLYLLILEDITVQKQNKFAHDQSERHLRTVFNQTSNIVLYERQDRSLFFSDNILHLTGYTSAEICRRQPAYESLVEPLDKVIIRRKYLRWLESGQSGVIYLWYRIKRRDGEIVWIEERMSLLRSESGEKIITGILIDNSELKRTEQELKQSEASLSKAQALAHLGSWNLELVTAELHMSQELYRIVGFEPGCDANWQNFLDYIHPEDIKEVKRRIKLMLEEHQESLSLEMRLLTANDEEKSVVTELELEWEYGVLLRVQGTLMDITERKELERQLYQNQKMEAIGTLAGGIAHDFNNILNIIMGYTVVIEGMLPNDSEIWYKFDRILAAAKRARNLVTHILTISRQHTPKRESIKVKELLEEHLELLRAAIPSIITFKPDLQSEGRIFGDPDQLEQIVMNLCTNSYYAMKPKGGKLFVRLYDVEDNICLEIEDTGCGISSKVLERIFDPYFTTKPKGEGTGLGLAIVKGIVEELGGEIEVTSETSKGSKFKILLPKYFEDEELISEVIPEAASEISTQEKIKVLFLDDEEELLELFTGYLGMNNMEVDGFDDSTLALEAFRQTPEKWDIIVSDISLPGIDGLVVVQRMRELNKKVPVIMYSGFKRPHLDETILELGIEKLLIKPVFPEDMVQEIRKILTKDGAVDEQI